MIFDQLQAQTKSSCMIPARIVIERDWVFET